MRWSLRRGAADIQIAPAPPPAEVEPELSDEARPEPNFSAEPAPEPDPATAGWPPGGRWLASGASVTGNGHLTKGLGCDDAFAYGTYGDFIVAAVADGAGSVTGTSAWGSFTVVDGVVTDALTPEFVESLRKAPRAGDELRGVMEALFGRALKRLERRAEESNLGIGKLATTLAVAVALPGIAVFAQIGDGVIALRGIDGIRTVLTEDKGDYANLTWFVQSESAFEQSFRVSVAEDVSAFALSTDGMAYKITTVATGAPFEPFFDAAWSWLESGIDDVTFAQWLCRVENDQTEDDKTLVLALLAAPPGSPEAGADADCTTCRRSSGWPPPLPSEGAAPPPSRATEAR